MYSDSEIKKVLNQALSRGGEFSEIFVEKNATQSLVCEDNKLEKIRSGYDQGAAIRVIVGSQTAYGYSNDLSYNSLMQVAEAVSQAVSAQKHAMDIDLRKPEANFHPVAQLPQQISVSKKAETVMAANDAARSMSGDIKQVTASYADAHQEVSIFNSLGLRVSDRRVRTRFAVNCIAARDGVIQTGSEAPGGHVGFEFFSSTQPVDIATTAAKRALLALNAKPAPAGEFTVVLAGEAGGTMVHEACGHALEGDFIYKKTSIFSDSLGKKVVSPLVTVVDDGTLSGHFGTLGYDDEGTPTQKNTLIENGVIKKFMCDRISANMLGVIPTGNGRRESYRNRPVPRMTNTYIAAGSTRSAEILASVKDGIFVKKMGGGQVDITNGDFVFEVTEGYRIRNGVLSEPLRGATLVGNGPQVLSIVDMVGDDLHFIPGMCGKYDTAPVTDGQPTLRIPKITVGGIA